MSDDWRAELDVEHVGGLRHLLAAAREHTVAGEARDRLGHRVVVTLDGDRCFAYASTEAEASEAAHVLSELAAAHDLEATVGVARWHPEEERWEPPGVPLPRTEAEHAAERATRDAAEAAESRARGFAEWEARVELDSHADTVALAERLEQAGLTPVRRAHFLVVGAESEGAAEALAERLRAEAPAGARVTVEGSVGEAWAEQHPFAILGGLGG